MNDRTNFSFNALEFVEGGVSREMFHSIYVEDHASWPEVLRAFADFMASVYGYTIDDQIIISKHNVLRGEKEETLLRDYF